MSRNSARTSPASRDTVTSWIPLRRQRARSPADATNSSPTFAGARISAVGYPTPVDVASVSSAPEPALVATDRRAISSGVNLGA